MNVVDEEIYRVESGEGGDAGGIAYVSWGGRVDTGQLGGGGMGE